MHSLGDTFNIWSDVEYLPSQRSTQNYTHDQELK